MASVCRSRLLYGILNRAILGNTFLYSPRSLSILSSSCSNYKRCRGTRMILSNIEAKEMYPTFRSYSSPVKDNHQLLRLPSLSPTMTHGSIKRWEKKVGENVAEGDLLCEIETDKAVMGFDASDEGVLAKILFDEGAKDIPVGTLLCVIVPDAADVPSFANWIPSASESLASADDSQPETPAIESKPKVTAQTSAPAVLSTPPSSTEKIATSGLGATPYARMLAKQHGVNLQELKGSGGSGQILADDVLKASSSPSTKAAPGPKVSATSHEQVGFVDIPCSNVRQVIAARLQESKQTIPHYYLSVDINVDRLLSMRSKLNSGLQKRDQKIKLSLNDFIIKASGLACIDIPEANSSWQGTFTRQYSSADVCVAVATDNGLITPIVFGANKKGLRTINSDIVSLAGLAREGKLMPHQYQGGTFTVSNLGMFGITNFSAIINPPQSCILAVGGVEKRVVYDEDHISRVRPADYLSVTLSCDHRVVDGAVGAQWLKCFKNYLEDPESMLL